MKYLNISKKLAAFAMAVLVLSACDKVDSPDPMGTAGQTIVKFTSSYTLLNVDFIPTPQQITLVDLRRDIPNNDELNKEMTIIIKDDPGAVTAYDPNIIPLPVGALVIDPTIPKVGSNYTMKMTAGQFAREIKGTISNATVLNLSNRYGLGFTIVSADANGKILGSQKTIVIEIGAKNKYDGIYKVTGTFSDVTQPVAFTSDYPFEYALVTSGANTCDVINLDLNGGIPGYLFLNNGAGTYYGAFGWVVTFDPTSGAITDWHNYYGDPTKAATVGGNPAAGTGAPLYAASNTRRATLDPSGSNTYDLVTRVINVKHYLIHPSVMGNNNPRAFFNEKWVYDRAR